MAYSAKNYLHLLGTAGFSNRALKNHMRLYQGYVTNANRVLEKLTLTLREGWTAGEEVLELKRRLGREFDSVRLHEQYFGNLGGSALLDTGGRLADRLIREFGTIKAWEKNFRETGLVRDAGWVILYHDTVNDHLFNAWINEHDVSFVAGCTPLLVMDAFEHAYMHDYGAKRADYIDMFFQTANWPVVETRLSGDPLT